MNKITAKAALLMTFVFGLTVAGYSQQPLLKANVPFEFSVGPKTFPAGEYQVIRISPQVLTLRASDSSSVTTFVTEPITTLLSRENPKLKFETAGGQYVLTEIWPDGAASGFQLVAKKHVNYVAQTPSSPEGQTATSTYVGK